MKKQKGKKKAFLAVLLSAAVICQTFPTYSLAAQGPDGICPHHTEHTAECGYREAAAEVPCNHQHTEECYKTETNCLHQHTEDCYPLVPSETDETQQVRGSEPTACTHVCSEESGCITKIFACTHVQVNEDGTTTLLHDEKCGYVAAQEASACQFVCEECKNTAAESERLAAEAEKAAQESQQKIDNVQSLISTLPEAEGITAENLEDVKAQLAAIEAAKAELDETQQASLQMEKYTAAVERIAALEAEPQKAPANLQQAGDTEQTGNAVAVVTINGKETECYSVEDIGNNMENGSIIKLLQPVPGGELTIAYKSDVTLNLNGQRVDTLHVNESSVTITGSGDISNLNIQFGSSAIIDGGIIYSLNAFSGTVTIRGGNIIFIIDPIGGVIYEPGSLTLDQSSLTLVQGDKGTLTATAEPVSPISSPDFNGFTYSWTSDNESVAMVNEDGNSAEVTAVGAGTANITVTVGNKTATCTVTVAEDYVATVTINGVETYCSTLEETFEIANGNTATIKLLKSIIDEKSEIKSHGVISSGNITLDMNGHTLDTPLCSIAVDGGTLIITGSGELDKVGAFSGSGGTVILESGKVEAVTPAFGGTFIVRGGSINSIMSSNATIEFQPGELLLNKDTLSLEAGKSEQLSATVNPSISVPGFGYSWESSDTAVATVDADGTVTAVAPGEATITVKAGNKTATCKVTVEDYVATVTKNGQTMSYYTLKEAFESIGENDIAQITLLKDIDEKIEGTERNESYTCRGDITLNGGGYLLKGEIRVSEGSRLLLQNISIASGVAVYGRLETGEGTEIYDITPKSGTTSITVGSVIQLRCKGGTTEISGGEIETFEHLGGSIIISGGTISRVGRLENPENVTFLADRIELSQEAFSLDAGETQNLTATVYDNFTVPEELFSGFTVTWESDNEQVASVDQNGTVTAKAGGIATITAKAGGKKASCAVTVQGDVASVTIGDQTQNYTDMDKAAEAVSGTGGTLTLLKDVSGRTQPLELSGPMTFDLGGHTLSGYWNDGAQGVVVINVGNVQVTNGKVKTEALATRAVNVEEGAILSGDAEYLGNNALRTKGIVSGGTFKGKSSVFENGTISGGIFEEIVSLSGSVQGGCFKNVVVDGSSEGLAAALVAGYVGYNNDGVVVWNHQTQGNTLDNFTGEVKAHTPHTYDFTTHEDGNGNYTCSESSCPICGITAPEGAAYTVTIPKTAQLGSDTEVSVNNSLSQEKTVTVSVNEKQVTLTRENDPEQTQIVSDVTFEDISVTKGQTDTEKVIFAPPVYNNDSDAVIPAGTYKGTLSFTIGMQ